MLKNKNIVLTGAGRGIGKILAKKLSSLGANLLLLSRTEEQLKETFNEINPISPKSFYQVIDISNIEQVEKAYKSCLEKFGTIDCLINNAGVQKPIGLFINNDLDEWKENINVNLFGLANCTHVFSRNMIKNKRGKIINFSGGGSTSPRSNFSAYAVSKTAILRFTETIACELKEYNVDINAVAPGAINTDMLQEVIDAKESAGIEFKDALLRNEAGGTDPTLVADLVSFLCSELSNDITGKLISAPWDKWKENDFLELLKNDKDFATLRRIDNKTFYKKI